MCTFLLVEAGGKPGGAARAGAMAGAPAAAPVSYHAAGLSGHQAVDDRGTGDEREDPDRRFVDVRRCQQVLGRLRGVVNEFRRCFET